MAYIKFISDKNLCFAINKVIRKIETKERDIDAKFHKNVIDPFAALFAGVTDSLLYKEWVEREKARQIQKTTENAIGDFHQDVLGAVPGWENLGKGGGLDVVCFKKKIIAEIKNKFNTTKGNDRIGPYDTIEAKLKLSKYKGYIGYYVEIIPNNKKRYNKEFTPSDSKTKKCRIGRNDIRIIDGVSFYAIATGRKNALKELFEVLPKVILDKHKYKLNKKEVKKYFELFAKAFSTE